MIVRIGKHLRAQKYPRNPKRKTDGYGILSNGGDLLGEVHWFGRWRQYVFEPNVQTVFNDSCLTDLAAFLARINVAHRQG